MSRSKSGQVLRISAASAGARAGCRAGPARWHGASFFICQSQPHQNVVDGREGATQARDDAQLLEGQIGFLVQQCPELMLVAGHNAGFASGTVRLRPHVTKASPLLQELLNHAQRHPEPAGHLLACALVSVIGRQNPFTQIKGNGFHAPRLPYSKINGYSFI